MLIFKLTSIKFEKSKTIYKKITTEHTKHFQFVPFRCMFKSSNITIDLNCPVRFHILAS